MMKKYQGRLQRRQKEPFSEIDGENNSIMTLSNIKDTKINEDLWLKILQKPNMNMRMKNDLFIVMQRKLKICNIP